MMGTEVPAGGEELTGRVLQSLLILGDDATLGHVAYVAEGDPGAVRSALQELAAAGLVEGDTVFALTPAGRAATPDPDPGGDRAGHRRAAQSLHRYGAPHEFVVPHLLAAGPMREPWAFETLWDHAEHCRRAGDHDGRVVALRAALDERPDRERYGRLMRELAHAESRTDPESAIQRYEAAIALTDDANERGALRIRFAQFLVSLRLFDLAVEHARTAVREAVSTAARWRMMIGLASIARLSLDYRDLGRDCLAEVRSLSGAELESASPDLLAELAYESCLIGAPRDEVRATATQAFGGPSLRLAQTLAPVSLDVVVLSLLWCGDSSTVERVARMTLARSDRARRTDLEAMANLWLLQVGWRQGTLDDAIGHGESALRAGGESNTTWTPATRGFTAYAKALRGDQAGVSELLDLPGGVDAWSGLATFHGYLHSTARIALLEGEAHRASSAALWLGSLASSMGTLNPAILPWRSLAALAAAATGEPETGADLARDDLVRARAFGAPGPVALALRALAANTDDPVDRVALLDEAVGMARESGYRIELIECLRARATTLDESALTAEAREARQEALGLAAQVGALALKRLLERDATARVTRSIRFRPTTRTEIRALGGFAVIDGAGHDVTPAGMPGRAVQVLVAAGRPLHPEELGDRLWDDPADPKRIRARLRNVVLRARAGEVPLIVRQGDLLALSADVELDTRRFDQLAADALASSGEDALDAALKAVSLYGGDLLPNEPYADWAQLERQRLRARLLSVVDMGARRASELGVVDVAINLLDAGIRHDPDGTERFELLAELHGQAGRGVIATFIRDRSQARGA